MADTGTYTCVAVSEMGIVEKTANIDVMGNILDLISNLNHIKAR